MKKKAIILLAIFGLHQVAFSNQVAFTDPESGDGCTLHRKGKDSFYSSSPAQAYHLREGDTLHCKYIEDLRINASPGSEMTALHVPEISYFLDKSAAGDIVGRSLTIEVKKADPETLRKMTPQDRGCYVGDENLVQGSEVFVNTSAMLSDKQDCLGTTVNINGDGTSLFNNPTLEARSSDVHYKDTKGTTFSSSGNVSAPPPPS